MQIYLVNNAVHNYDFIQYKCVLNPLSMLKQIQISLKLSVNQHLKQFNVTKNCS